MLLLSRWLLALVHGELTQRIVSDEHELQLVLLLSQALNLLLQARFFLLQLFSLLQGRKKKIRENDFRERRKVALREEKKVSKLIYRQSKRFAI